MFIDFREGEGETEGERERYREIQRETEIDQCLLYVHRQGIEPPTFWRVGGLSNHLTQTGQV